MPARVPGNITRRGNLRWVFAGGLSTSSGEADAQASASTGRAMDRLASCRSVAPLSMTPDLPARATQGHRLACVIQQPARLGHVRSLLLRTETALATNATSGRTALKNTTLAAAGGPSLASNHCQSLSSKTFCWCWIALPACRRAPGNAPAPTDTSTDGFETSSHPVARKGRAGPDPAQLEASTGHAYSPVTRPNKSHG